MPQTKLKDVPFFSTLSRRELNEVARQTDEVDAAAGKTLAREGGFGYEFFVILEGTADVVRGEGKIAELGPGDFFGEMALPGEERRNATVTATSPMRLLVMTRESLRAIDRSMPAVHKRIVEAIEARRATTEPAAI
jgi:CRP/FNR family transcriptional regulator, cyclic AMP receptor protein